MKKKIVLVLSGGGARGIAHIGVIEELESRGYHISSIAGTSMGAVVGGFYAMGKLSEFKEFLLTLDKRKTFRLLDFNLGTQGLIKGEKLMNTLKDHLGEANIEDFNIPFIAVAADVLNKREVLFSSGSIYKAIRASVAIPSFFTPVKTDSGLLVDGGVMNNIPINHAIRSSGDNIFAVDVNANMPALELVKTEKEEKKQDSLYKQKLKRFNDQVHNMMPKGFNEQMGFVKLMDNTISLMMHQMSAMHIKNHKPDLLINVSRNNCSTFDFFKASDIIEIGRMAAIRSLNEFEFNQ